MKKLLSILVILLSATLSSSASTPTKYFFAGNPIKFCGQSFSLAWSSHPQENYYVQEYLPKGETADHYNQMFTVCVIFGNLSPREAAQAKVNELEQRKQIDPVTNYIAIENNGEHILEFIVSDTDGSEINTVEVDMHYYRQMKINNKNACVLYFFSQRAYGDDITTFIQSIPDKRTSWYDSMTQLDIKPEFIQK